jgi:hypothetical protein
LVFLAAFIDRAVDILWLFNHKHSFFFLSRTFPNNLPMILLDEIRDN